MACAKLRAQVLLQSLPPAILSRTVSSKSTSFLSSRGISIFQSQSQSQCKHQQPTTRRPFSTTPPKTANTMSGYETTPFLQAATDRRSIYTLNKSPPIPDSRIRQIITSAITHVPSSFNSQSTRLIVLLGAEHDKFWSMTTSILKAMVPPEKWEKTAARMAMFAAAYGSVLFYEDPAPIRSLQSKLPEYADRFPVWSEHTSAMHQYFIWTALEAEGLGANLQHYNPLPDQKVAETWGVPLEWSLKAQLVFGGLEGDARGQLKEKEVQSVEERVKIYGAKEE